MFHVCHVAAAFHRDLLEHRDLLTGERSEAPWTADREILQHKDAALTMLQSQIRNISTLTGLEIDRLIFAAVTFARHEASFGHSDARHAHFFSPHFPAAHWAGLYGRVRTVKVHAEAVVALVAYRGGLSAITMEGVAGTVAR